MQDLNARTYWKKNISYVTVLLAIWFLVAYCCSIFWKTDLDRLQIGGMKMGFWIAQQGSIYVFVVLIFVYVWLMNKLDKKYGVYED
jgi:putative solute:sodium symporter small subunit